MSAGERRTAIAIAVALGGCMHIYPDPDLPDVRVEWFTEDCLDASDRVTVSLTGTETATQIGPVTASCAASSLRIDDVPRERYVVTTEIVAPDDGVLGMDDQEIDLRAGDNARLAAYFSRSLFPYARATVAFAMGASCQSLKADVIHLKFSAPEQPVSYGFGPCKSGLILAVADVEGVFTVTAQAANSDAVVATSPPSAPMTFTRTLGAPTDIGEFTLSPCGTTCPGIFDPVR